MSEKLRILILEDRPADAELVLREVRRTGYEPEWSRVETEAEYLAQLDQGWDLILADYNLPQFTGLRALELLTARGLDIPFIIVSGTIGEDKAVAAMKAGAKDYVMKDQLARLGSAIERELRDAVDRREFKRAEAALVASEMRYRRLFESAQDGIVILDAVTGMIVDINPFLLNLLGYARQAVLGRKIWEIGFSKDLLANQSNFTELQQKGSVRYEDLPLETIDGRRIEVEFVSNVYLVGGHKVIQCNIRDITERRQAERALRLQSAALTAAANPMVITDRGGTIQWVNTAFAEVTGYGAEESLGKNPRQLLRSGVHEPTFYKDMWDTILGGAVWHGEITNRRKDGTLYPEEMTITPVKDASGEITHFVAIKQDLTRRKQLEAQLRQAQKMESVGRLAGGIAHDFNNLLTVILGTVDLSLADRNEADPLLADLLEVRRAGEQAARLTRQLLAFSRQQILQPKVLNLNEAVAEMMNLLQRLLGEDVTVAFAPGIDLDFVKVDPGQVEQVLINLGINARDAMPGGGTLTIETRNVTLDEAFAAGHPTAQPGPHVQLLVSDTGIGMDEATRLQIFEPFFTTKTSAKGTGLGLSTVYGIVKQSGGTIWVQSDPGRGSCFSIYLPRAEGPPTTTEDVPPVTVSRGSETILVVEDENALRSLAKRLLETAGYSVLVAANGEEALACIERQDAPVHLVLTDLVMPGMGGRELAKRLSARFPKLKIVFTSGYTDDAILHQGPFDDGTHFLGKPYTMAGLRTKVRNVLDSPGDRPTGA